MLKAVSTRSEGFCARFALGALALLPVMLGGCSSTVGEEAAYVSAYQPYRDICVISKGEHSPVFDSGFCLYNKKALVKTKAFEVVVGDGFEPPTQGFSVLCSTS